jgi:hypothetical protein
MNDAILSAFAKKHKFAGKGPLSVALFITQKARLGLPLNSAKLLTQGGGQIEGLGPAAVQAVLSKHGITRILSQEAGRTSRGSIGKMRTYVEFLNQHVNRADLDLVERFWVGRVREFFAGKPFKFRVDEALSVRAAIRDILQQAKDRQKEIKGARYEGTMLQHLVGAKLDLVLGLGKIEHHAASEADQADDRAGDFIIGDVAVHVTTSASESLIRKCAANLSVGLHPVIVTLPSKAAVADSIAETAGVQNRVDILDIEQFLAANLHERALFDSAKRRPKTLELISRYNALIDEFEADPSLKIELAKR